MAGRAGAQGPHGIGIISRRDNRERAGDAALRALLLAAALLAVCGPAEAEPAVHETTDYYAIHGANEKDLRREMDRLGHREADGRRFDANARTGISWDFTYRTTSDECSIGIVLVQVEVRYLLPRWVDEESAPRLLRDKWDVFMEHVIAHEHNHGALARQAAAGLEAALLSLPAGRFCDDVGRRANELAKDSVKQLQRSDEAYDERTKHGFTEGAFFPE